MLNEVKGMKFIGLALLTLYVLFVSAYIEVMNVRAGGRLPNREYRNGDPSQGVVKWRISILPASDREISNNRLREFVGTFGLTQYVAAPALIILSGLILKNIKEHKFIAIGLPLAIGILGCFLMFYRAYFTSLGI